VESTSIRPTGIQGGLWGREEGGAAIRKKDEMSHAIWWGGKSKKKATIMMARILIADMGENAYKLSYAIKPERGEERLFRE